MKKINILLLALCCCCAFDSIAQTDMDAIMMDKKQFCVGPMYSHSSWKNYWEGSFKRENLNIGTVATSAYSVMGNYGISSKLNVLFSVPYIKTSASAGTMKGMKGIQDLSLFVKWMPIEKKWGPGTFSLYGIGGLSVPLTNYVADFLPLAIGLQSKTASIRLMLDYQINSWFATVAATYIQRNNIKIDRTMYYTTTTHLSNEVEMPNASNINFRAGYRSDKLIAEAVLNNFTTQGGFDISKNNMPFPSNKMNATTIGANIKYVVLPSHDLAVVAGANTAIAGRNVGQSTTVYGGLFYVMDFSSKKPVKNQPAKK